MLVGTTTDHHTHQSMTEPELNTCKRRVGVVLADTPGTKRACEKGKIKAGSNCSAPNRSIFCMCLLVFVTAGSTGRLFSGVCMCVHGAFLVKCKVEEYKCRRACANGCRKVYEVLPDRFAKKKNKRKHMSWFCAQVCVCMPRNSERLCFIAWS